MLKVILMVVLCFSSRLCSENHCGKPIGYGAPSSTRRDRIVGGYDLGFYKYPWYAALYSHSTIGCGGSLINSRTVLTAAHCFKRESKKIKLEDMYIIKLGVYNVCTTESTQVEFKVAKVTVHELWAKKNPYYDIALVILKKDASAFTPICLPSHPIEKRPREGLVPGLGVLKYDGDTPCTLQESRLLIHPDSECKSMLMKVEKSVANILNAFCAGYIQGGVDTCQGDSGGPLQIPGNDGRYTLLGIVSFGYKCAAPGVLGLYTDVSRYIDWIKKHSSDSSTEHINPSDQISTEVSSIDISKPDGTPQPSESTLPSQNPMPSVITAGSKPNPMPSVITAGSKPNPMPSVISVGSKPNQFLQFYPVRPIGVSRPSNQSPINIFIFNRRNLKKTKNIDKKKNHLIKRGRNKN